MDEVLHSKWWMRLFFAGTTILFGGLLYTILSQPGPPGYVTGSPIAGSQGQQPVFHPGDTFSIPKGKSVPVGDIRLTYRGVSNGCIHLEVIVASLDPNYSYLLSLQPAEAKTGFRTGGRSFQMVSARRSRIRLLLTD